MLATRIAATGTRVTITPEGRSVVQPGVGNPVPAHETYALKEMSEASLRVLRTRRDIACVLVNPVQIMHPNSAAPADSTLVDRPGRRVSTARPMPIG